MQDKVTRLRQLLSESIPQESGPGAKETAAKQAYQLFELNTAPPIVVIQTPRARNEREIERIATWYGWSGEIVRALDKARALTMAGLSDDDIEELLERMKRLEECVREGLDCPDAPP